MQIRFGYVAHALALWNCFSAKTIPLRLVILGE